MPIGPPWVLSNAAHVLDNARAAAAGPLHADVYAEAKRRLDAAGSRPDA